MTAEESAIQVDWRSKSQEPDALTDPPTRAAFQPDSPAASDAPAETSVMQLSAVLIVTLAGMATTFALAAIILVLATHG